MLLYGQISSLLNMRVPAFAWWPGTIKPNQLVGDIIHETDLFTTFARLGDATQHIPTDRVIDGVDETGRLAQKAPEK